MNSEIKSTQSQLKDVDLDLMLKTLDYTKVFEDGMLSATRDSPSWLFFLLFLVERWKYV